MQRQHTQKKFRSESIQGIHLESAQNSSGEFIRGIHSESSIRNHKSGIIHPESVRNPKSGIHPESSIQNHPLGIHPESTQNSSGESIENHLSGIIDGE